MGFDNRCQDWRKQRDCLHPTVEYFVVINSNGRKQVALLCDTCHKNTLGSAQWIAHNRVPGSVDALPVIADMRTETNPCARCGAFETELHHWAPIHLFEDAWSWPMSYLCVPCHQRWHRRIVEHWKAA